VDSLLDSLLDRLCLLLFAAQMTCDRRLLAASSLFAGASAFGSVTAIRHGIPGQPLGVSIPLSVSAGVRVGWGAGIAAPWPMPMSALIAAATTSRGQPSTARGTVCVGLGLGCLAGTLVEPVTYRPTTWPPAVRAAIMLNIAASVALAAAGWRHLRSR